MSDKYKELNWREKVGKPKRKKKTATDEGEDKSEKNEN